LARTVSEARSTRKREKEVGIKEILSGKSKEELVEFLSTMATESEEVKQRVLINSSNENTEKELERCVKLIRTHIQKKSDQWGFVHLEDSEEAIKGAELVLEKARKASVAGDIPIEGGSGTAPIESSKQHITSNRTVLYKFRIITRSFENLLDKQLSACFKSTLQIDHFIPIHHTISEDIEFSYWFIAAIQFGISSLMVSRKSSRSSCSISPFSNIKV